MVEATAKKRLHCLLTVVIVMDEGEKAEATAMDEARMIAVVFMVQLDRIIINDTMTRIL